MTSEVGGTGHSVVSPFAAAQKFASGKASILVSGGNTHLVGLVDGPGGLRALGYAGQSSSTTSPNLGAESTALALLMLCAGVTVTEPGESADRLARLRALSSFRDLVAKLRSLLPTRTVPEAAQDPEVQALITAVLDQFDRQAPRSLGIDPDIPRFGVAGKVLDADPTSAVRLGMTQGSWRSAALWRRDQTTSGGDFGSVIEHATYLPGFETVQLGDLIRGKDITPGAWEDPVSADFDSASEMRYYVVGPGFAAKDGSVGELPDEISAADVGKVWAVNVIAYGLFPALDVCSLGLVFSSFKTAAKVVAVAQETLSLLLKGDTSGGLLQSLGRLGTAASAWLDGTGSREAVEGAIVDFLQATLSAAVAFVDLTGKDLVVGGVLLIAVAKLSLLSLILSGLAAVLGAANMYLAYLSWSSVPPVFTVSFVGKGDGTIIIR